MTVAEVDPLLRAILYEGYLLYPYGPSSLKNQHRWTLGCIVPRVYSEANPDSETSLMQLECVMCARPSAALHVTVRFLQVAEETKEREIAVPALQVSDLATRPYAIETSFPPVLHASTEVSVAPIQEDAYKLRIRVWNLTPLERPEQCSRDEVLPSSLSNALVLVQIKEGRFISQQDPPSAWATHCDACRSKGVWPILLGTPDQTNLLVGAPIILPDYPRIAPESPGDFFDATEIDELLTLRVQTLTEREQQEMRTADPHAQALLARVHSMSPDRHSLLLGAWRDGPLKTGMRVRLRPRRRADALDLLLSGKLATIVGIERDFENRTHVAVSVDEDPGNDLGEEGQPGHRFFFGADEVEPVRPGRILIAGIGNIFLGDDAFGCEVLRRLAELPAAEGVVLKDFGIRGFDLACAIQDGYDAVILVDAYAHGSAPGDLCVVEPTIEPGEGSALPNAHMLAPRQVLSWVLASAGRLPIVRLVGCEPASFEFDEDHVGISAPVQAAIEPALEMIQRLVAELRTSDSATCMS